VQVWEKQAEDLAPEVVKGARVVVVGDVHSREYEKDGATRTVYDVKGKTVAVVPRGDAKVGAFSGPGAASADPWSAPAVSTDEAPF
jgi:single-stranded DNA-binding protein